MAVYVFPGIKVFFSCSPKYLVSVSSSIDLFCSTPFSPPPVANILQAFFFFLLILTRFTRWSTFGLLSVIPDCLLLMDKC